MELLTTALFLLIAAFSVSAQVLTDGNSQLPACASNCGLLSQAAAACGGTTSADQTIWSCFCQSGYLTSLYNSPNGICDSVCTSASDNQQVMTWFTGNCGTDDGASEHAGSGSGATTVVQTSTSATATATVVPTSGAPLPTTTSGGFVSSGDANSTSPSGSWWSNHYKWVIMIIVIFFGLLVLALLAVYLKRRHRRRADQIHGPFNTGITARSMHGAGDTSMRNSGMRDSTYLSNTQMSGAGGTDLTSGRDSPVRTRDAFMPYGYGYARSESRLASRTDMEGQLARGGDLEKDAGMGEDITPEPAAPKRGRRVLVRERSMGGPESPETEKGGR